MKIDSEKPKKSKFVDGDMRRARHPSCPNGKEKHTPWFPIVRGTPLLDGTGSGRVRGWVVGGKSERLGPDPKGKCLKARPRPVEEYERGAVRINWGMFKWMPAPDLKQVPKRWYEVQGKQLQDIRPSMESMLYCLAFNVVIVKNRPKKDGKWRRATRHLATGWIPVRCIKGCPATLSKAFACQLDCMTRLVKSQQEQTDFMKDPRAYMDACCEIGAVDPNDERFCRFYFTRRRHRGGRAHHYINRAPDKRSGDGYVNLCLNLLTPGLRDKNGGIALDVFPAEQQVPFIACPQSAAKDLAHVSVSAYKETREMHFQFGAVPYWEAPGKVAWRFGWIATAVLRAVPLGRIPQVRQKYHLPGASGQTTPTILQR